MNYEELTAAISPANPWRDKIQYYSTITSTNDVLKQMAAQGAPHGTVLIADQQTGGRGRLGRTFLSPPNVGIYLSALLRPACHPTELMHLTCAVAAAMCNAIEASAGFRPQIKWTNDLVFRKRKLAGILTELALRQDGTVDYAVIGIGINCCQKEEDFPTEIRGIAGSLEMVSSHPVDRSRVAAAMVMALENMDALLLTQKEKIMEQYRQDCITIGQQVQVVKGDTMRFGKAVDVDEEGALLVDFGTGIPEPVNSGEVSVRGMYGYV